MAYLKKDDSASFDPETDSDRPVVGSVVTATGMDGVSRLYRIKHVEAITASELMSSICNDELEDSVMAPALFEAEDCFALEHETRPFVVWLCWADKV